MTRNNNLNQYGVWLGCCWLMSLSWVAAQESATQTQSLGTAAHSTFTAIQNSDGLTLLDGIEPVLTYRSSTQSLNGRWPRANYVHPLYGLNGQVLTEDFPADHGHHRGIFWAWHQVLVSGQAAGDAWLCKDFLWDVESLTAELADQRAIVKAKVVWRSPDITDGNRVLPIAEERVRISAYARETNFRSIDFEITILPLLDDVRIGGSDDQKGYGGFSPRMKLHPDAEFRGPRGIVEPKMTAVEAGSWISIDQPGSGLAMLCHPDNPSAPQPWILRGSRSMQNAAYPGHTPVTLSQTTPLVLKYRLVIHNGTLATSTIDEIYQQYSSKPN